MGRQNLGFSLLVVNKEVILKVKEWINDAEDDLRLAKHSLTMESFLEQ